MDELAKRLMDLLSEINEELDMTLVVPPRGKSFLGVNGEYPVTLSDEAVETFREWERYDQQRMGD